VLTGIGKPLLTPDNMRNLHLPIIDNIGKMKSGKAIPLNNNKIIKDPPTNHAIILIPKTLRRLDNIPLNPDRIALPPHNPLLNLTKGQVPTLPIIGLTNLLLILFLLFFLLL
jgi:hypothetical protein